MIIPKINSSGSATRKIVINSWRKGYNSFLDGVRRDNSSVDKALNMVLKQDGVVTKRWGTRNYGTGLPGNKCEGVAKFSKYNPETEQAEDWLIGVSDGKVYVSRNAKTWRMVEGATLTPGREICFLNTEEKVFMANRKDTLRFYDIIEDTVKKYEKIEPPKSPTLARQGDLATGDISIFYRISAVNDVGETEASESVEIKVNKQRSTWKNEKDKIEAVKIDWSAVAGAKRYNIYYSDEKGQECYIDSVSSTTYTDDARMAPNMAIQAPKDNTTGGPIVGIITYSDNRIWGVGDPENPYRVYFGGVGAMTTAFSPFYGGGWVDVVRGGAEFPTVLQGHRDGKGDNTNTIFMSGANGEGSQYQISLQSMTVGTTTFVIPMVARIIGSLGTSAPRSVVEVKNNLYYSSINSFNTTGVKPEMLNVLSTDEISLAIRKDVRKIGSSNARKIASEYFDGKILWAVANGDSENNEIWILDMELNCWMLPWKIPAKYFIKHTDELGEEHLLFLPSKTDDRFSENCLVEISENINGDNGKEFETHFSTGIIPMDGSHMEWAKVKKIYLELLESSGDIEIEISGDMKNRGFEKIKKFKISNRNIPAGWGNQLWDGFLWDSAPTASKALTLETLKKVVKISKKLNNIRIEIKSGSSSNYMLSILAIELLGKRVSDPSGWKK